jgi:hypothetical protein
MANRWGIPKDVEDFVIERDRKCVYCGVEFSTSENNRKNKQSWEHIINDIQQNGADNIALCCVSCNASKGNKSLVDWMNGKYCKEKMITFESVSPIIKTFLLKYSKY